MRPLLATVLLLLPSAAVAEGRFDTVAIHIERNATDGDSEVVVEAIARDAGLAALDVLAPDGHAVVSFKAARARLGMRHLTFETPEPKDAKAVLAEFPAGTYRFEGTTVGGERVRGQAVLGHAFPADPAITSPGAEADAVPTQGLVVRWNPIANLAAWVVTVEQEKTGREVKATLAGDATSLTVPDGFLEPGTEYKVGVGAFARDGNASFVESDFTTAGKS